MAVSDSKAIARQFIEEILGKGNFDLLDAITAEGYLDHNLPSGVTPRQSISAFRAGFPDLRVAVEDVIAEGDKAVVRYNIHATNTGNFFGMPATGKSVKMSGISIYRIVEGKLAEGWVEYDQLGLMQQLGAVGGAG
jgi:predicted ester cyclase